MKFVRKWIGGLILAAVFGYFVLGPRLAGDGRFKSLAQKGAEAVSRRLAPGEAEPGEAEPNESSDAPNAPKVSVGVTPVEEPRRR